MKYVIYKSHNHNITIAFPLRYKLRQMCKYEYSLLKNLLTYWKTGKENQETIENILAQYESYWVLKNDYVTGKKLSNPMMGE